MMMWSMRVSRVCLEGKVPIEPFRESTEIQD